MLSVGFSSSPGQVEDHVADPTELTLDEIDRQLNNPLANFWSLVFQDNFNVKQGDSVDGTTNTNTLFFQPSLPVPIGDYLWFARPVFPVVTVPVVDPQTGVVETRKTGFGDIQILSLIGPLRTEGVVWGIGATFKFPTASNDALGEGKWQAGPGGMYFYLGKPWTIGVLAQHWWSYAGDSDRPKTNQTDIQYTARRSFPGAWSLGMGPTVTINWEASEGNKVTFPIGLGITKTVRIGQTPVKLRLEPQYSIISPSDFGTTWNIRFQVVPVIGSPFSP